jgi:hypothetical protein
MFRSEDTLETVEFEHIITTITSLWNATHTTSYILAESKTGLDINFLNH